MSIGFLEFNCFKDKLEFLRGLSTSSKTLVVADLETKLMLKHEWLQSRSYVAEDQLLRVSELWRKIYQRLHPDAQIISAPLTRILVHDYLQSKNLSVGNAKASSRRLCQFITQISPVLAHPEGEQLLREWWVEHEAAKMRWESWLEVAIPVWNFLLEKNLVCSEWLPALLSFENEIERVWKSDLVFDIGSEILGPETELIKSLATRFSVQMIAPAKEDGVTGRIAKLYQALGWEAEASATSVAFTDIYPKRFTSQLAEIKAATAQVREWLEAGVAPTEIVIIAPSLDDYLEPLHRHLAEEGIPFEQQAKTPLNGFPQVQQWMARLRFFLRAAQPSDLLLGSFLEQKQISFERMKKLFSHVYDVSDLQRDARVFQTLQRRSLSNERISRDQFVLWALAQAPHDLADETIETIFKRFLAEAPANENLLPTDWQQFLVDIIRLTQVAQEDDEVEAVVVRVTHLRTSEGLLCPYRIILGLSEEQLQASLNTPVLGSEADALAQDLGFYLIYPESQLLQMAARKYLHGDGHAMTFLFYAENSFDGRVLTPSALWLKTCVQAEVDPLHISSLGRTRWDDLQRSETVIFPELANEIGLTESPVWKNVPPVRLSASSIKDFLKCPFTFAATRAFKLRDENVLDLDLDPMMRGQLMHKALELAWSSEPVTLENCEQILERAKEALQAEVGDTEFWLEQRRTLARYLQRVLNSEQQFMKDNPQWRNTLHELDFQVWLGEDGIMEKQKSRAEQLELRGRIDRMDQSEDKKLALIDYKMSVAGQRHWKKWIDNHDLQLAIYQMAIEVGGTEQSGEVVGTLYYDLKNARRAKGWVLDAAATDFGNVPKGCVSTAEEFMELRKNVQEVLGKTVQRVNSGELNPQPEDIKVCQSCHWRGLCRSPHLL